MEATHQRNTAQRAAQKAERVSEFLRSILASADPREAGADMTIRDALDRAVREADAQLVDEPEVLADVHAMVGSIFVRMEQPDRGEGHLRRALDLRRQVFGDESCLVADTMADLAWIVACGAPDQEKQRATLFERAMAIKSRLFGANSAEVATLKVHLASVRYDGGDHAESIRLCREAQPVLRAAFGDDAPTMGFAWAVMGRCLFATGDDEAGEAAFRKAMAIQRAADGELYALANTLTSFARFLRQRGREREAATLLGEADEIRRQRIGSAVKRLGPRDN